MQKIPISTADLDETADAPLPALEWSPLGARRYWEQRARLFGSQGDGLAAVCSYGMPRFYNAYIQMTQSLALRPYLQVTPADTVLDVGCGIGRWSLPMAERGARVTGVDLSAYMVDQARRRSQAQGLAERCLFLEGDVAELALEQQFSRILMVTVLQHILDDQRCQQAIERLAAHLAPTGSLVVLEAAPARPLSHCDSAVFRARSEGQYREWFAQSGLGCVQATGVDPMPLKIGYLPVYKRLPRPLAVAGLAAVTALSAPVDLVTGRKWRRLSWHKVMVFRHQR